METSRPEGRRFSYFVLALVVSCLGLAILDVGLVLRTRDLEAQVSALSRALERAERVQGPLLAAGEFFPEISLFDVAGRPIQVVPGPVGLGTLLFISSQSCDNCDDVRPIWHDVALKADGSPLRVLELVLDANPATLLERETIYPRVVPGDDATELIRQIAAVPASILIDESGVVQRVLYGDQHALLEQAVEDFLPR